MTRCARETVSSGTMLPSPPLPKKTILSTMQLPCQADELPSIAIGNRTIGNLDKNLFRC